MCEVKIMFAMLLTACVAVAAATMSTAASEDTIDIGQVRRPLPLYPAFAELSTHR